VPLKRKKHNNVLPGFSLNGVWDKIGFSFILLVLTSLMVLSVHAQQSYPTLTPETQAKFENQLRALSKHYKPEKEINHNIALPHLWPSLTDITPILEKFSPGISIVNAEKTMAFLFFYAYEHPDETAVLLALAEQQKEQYATFFQADSMPPELGYLPLVSSGMHPDYVSASGAVGLWQFKYSTARLYDLRVTEYLDERRETSRSTIAAAKMLKDFYRQYEQWPLAIAAWSCGPCAVNKAIKDTGNPGDLKAVFKKLPVQEADIYHAFTAMNIIIENPGEFGIKPASIKVEAPKDTVLVQHKLHFGQVSALTGIDEKLLEKFNPGYPQSIVPATPDNNLPLYLPQDMSELFMTNEDSMYHHRDSFYFSRPKPEDNLANGSRKKNIPDDDYVPVSYTIKSGDNIGFLSEWFDTPVSNIRYWNNIHGNFIRAGQTIVVYVLKDKKNHYTALESMSFTEKQAREGKLVSNTSQKERIRGNLKQGTYILYTVKRGDNPWQIAKQYPGISDQDILRWNNISPHDLRPGQKLKIKKQRGSK
jgi:membrane-bound lytic murein transglycosylase D